MNFNLMDFIFLLAMSSLNVQLSFGDEVPSNVRNKYWGPGKRPSNIDESIRPFKIDFDRKMINDLKKRLKNTRELQPPLENVSWSYGADSNFMPVVVDYWLNKYDFKKREKYLNQYSQFITNIQGLDIHFVHVKPQLRNDSEVEVIPLYVQHGWLGSVAEFYKIVPMLTTVRPDRNFVFEMIIPSLPGFGYSSASAKPGLGQIDIAPIMKELMLRLGFTKWYTHGGNWGSFITTDMAILYPEHVLGMHSNWCLVFNPLSFAKEVLREIPLLLVNWTRVWSLTKMGIWLFEQTGFISIQGTKPDTIGIGLTDSPTGLAAYFLDKFVACTRKNMYGNGNEKTLMDYFTMDELVDTFMLYWAPNKVTSAMRHHAEYFTERNLSNLTLYEKVKVPSACVQFHNELINLPEKLVRDRFVNMVRFTKISQGGHFAAMEEPQLLADDIWAAVEKMRK